VYFQMKKLTKLAATKLKKTLKQNRSDDSVIEFFIDYFMDKGEMPYEAARAHDADPYEWTTNKIAKMKTPELEKIVDTLTESITIKELLELRNETNV
jgi:hypothetical protein